MRCIMKETISVKIAYHSGNRFGQIITIEGVEPEVMMETLGEITQNQKANAEITIDFGGSWMEYEDFLFEYFKDALEEVENQHEKTPRKKQKVSVH